jgi:hypothetical protein
MWTQTSDGREIIADLCRPLVTQFAADERDLFSELLDQHLEDPDAKPEEGAEEPLAFGIGTSVLAITPIIASMLIAALSYIGSEFGKAMGQQSADFLSGKLKAILHGKEVSPVGLTNAQIERVRSLAKAAGIKRGLKPSTAGQIADGLAVSLLQRFSADSSPK